MLINSSVFIYPALWLTYLYSVNTVMAPANKGFSMKFVSLELACFCFIRVGKTKYRFLDLMNANVKGEGRRHACSILHENYTLQKAIVFREEE